MMMKKTYRITLAAALLTMTAPAPARAQIADFLGPHVIETLPHEIPGTGRIGGVTLDSYGYLYVANQDEGIWKIHPSGDVEHFVDGLYGSGGGTMLPNGELLHAAYNSDRIVRVQRDGTVHAFVDEGL